MGLEKVDEETRQARDMAAHVLSLRTLTSRFWQALIDFSYYLAIGMSGAMPCCGQESDWGPCREHGRSIPRCEIDKEPRGLGQHGAHVREVEAARCRR